MTRIVDQTKGERNYHIFYQLLRGASADLREKLHLSGNATEFAYLAHTDAKLTSVSDEDEFALTQDCMEHIGLSTSLREDIFALLSGILHLGNTRFECDDGEGQVGGITEQSQSSFQIAAKLLGFYEVDLLAALTKQNMFVGGSIIVKTQTQAQANDKLDSVAKSIYTLLFIWLIDTINSTIVAPESMTWGFIGVLDIYGFENFTTNGFEQLLINYANEKLQNHFNKHIFLIEQAEYASENIDWSFIQFNDNQSCIDLIDGKINGKTGVFQTLDDAAGTARSDVNTTFLTQITQTLAGQSAASSRHAHFLLPRFNSDRYFGVKHYAGDVYYEITGFAEKNRDSTTNDVKELMMSSTNYILRSMMDDGSGSVASSPINSPSVTSQSSKSARFPSIDGRPSSFLSPAKGPISKLKEDSISKQFTASLKQLYDTLDATEPHYIRCVKPNAFKQPNRLHGKQALEQLKYAGMMETIRIRSEGYAFRQSHEQFFNRFQPIIPSCRTLKDLVVKLSDMLSVHSEAWQSGTTKIFIKTELNEKLEILLGLRYSSACRMIQKCWRWCVRKQNALNIQTFWRCHHARRKYVQLKRAAVKFQSKCRKLIARRTYNSTRKNIVLIQTSVRGKLARNKLRKMRNPYIRMTYEELCSQYEKIEAIIQTAFEKQQFDICEECEAKLGDIRHVRSKFLATATIMPLSRKEVELLVLELTCAIEYATSHHEPPVVAAMQERLTHLLSLRKSYPTVEEVQGYLVASKEQLQVSMDKREFRKCTELRDTIAALENQLEIALFTGSYASPPLLAMKSKRVTLETELATALDAKNFELCDKLQGQLEPLLAEVVRFDIPCDEIKQIISQNNEASRLASSKLDFREVARLQYKTDELERLLLQIEPPVLITDDVNSKDNNHIDQLSSANDVDQTQERFQSLSYDELTQLLKTLKTELERSVATKSFKRCGELEAEIQQVSDTLAIRPTPEAPMTRIELDEKIKSTEKDIAQALAEKKYKLCDELNGTLEQLKKLIEKLPTSAELSIKIAALEQELDLAIKSKNYSQCDEIESSLVSLREQYVTVKATEPEPEQIVPMAEVKTRRSMVRPPQPLIAQFVITESQESLTNLTAVTSSTLEVPVASVTAPVSVIASASSTSSNDRPVSKLRPKVPITLLDDATVLEVAQAMALNRADAALLVSAKGGLSGIITDNDITRRVLALRKDPTNLPVVEVMTRSPKCVSMADSALDALDLMVINRFRHLPVLDEKGLVVGLLDIAKCLHDAISALERVQKKDSDTVDNEASKLTEQLMKAAAKKNKGGNKNQLAVMQAMMEQLFGDRAPTLRVILNEAHFVCVAGTDSISQAAEVMAKARKGVLVMDGDKLIGILTPKDLLSRVVAKELVAGTTAVSSVMTPNPDCVSADLTLLDALREMHDQKFLHLPVRESDSTVLGVVDVMELVCSTAGGEDGKGWRDFFKGAMDIGDDASDSEISERSASRMKKRRGSIGGDAQSVISAPESTTAHRPVSSLRPKMPVLLSEDMTVQTAVEALAARRADAGLILDTNTGKLLGIITDNDITRRVLSQCLDPTVTAVTDVMTKGPKFVHPEDSALDALDTMVENKFRHLPVLNEKGVVIGLLDIAKCLHDAISVLEQVQEEESAIPNDNQNLVETMKNAMKNAKGGNKNQLALMQAMMEQMFGGSIPTLRGIIGDSECASLKSSATVREASILMTKVRKGVLVMEDGELVGILTPKDLLSRVIACKKHPEVTAVASVMTPNPDCVSADLTLLDALREMHDQKFLHLPVRESDGTVLGVVDVMELVRSTAGGEDGKGWRDFFKGAMEARGDNASESDNSSSRLSPRRKNTHILKLRKENSEDLANTEDFESYEFMFKVTDTEGHIHKLSSPSDSIELLRDSVASKFDCTAQQLILKYEDEDGDNVILTGDAALREAVDYAKRKKFTSLRISATIVGTSHTAAPISARGADWSNIPPTTRDDNSNSITSAGTSRSTGWLVGGAIIVAVAASVSFVVFSRRNK